MKLILTFITALLIQFSAAAIDTTLTFRQVDYSQIFEIAKEENKAVLLYFHYDGCGACLKMEKTAFLDKHVADFYNSNFVSLEVNTEKGEGIATNEIYNVYMHPTFLFLDENGNVLHKIVGVFNSEEFLLHAKNSLNTLNSLSYFKKQYMDGNREASFLYDYCYKLNDAYELDSLIINEYLNTQSINDLSKEENIKFIYEFAIHDFVISTPFNSNGFKFLINNQEKFYQYFDKDQIDARIIMIVYSSVYKAIENQNELLFNNSIDLLKPFDTGQTYFFKEMDGRITGMIANKSLVLSSKMEFYDRSGDSVKYNVAFKKYLDKIWNDSEALNTLAWNYYLNYEDKVKLEKAVKCVKRSINLNSNYANNDTYASLLYKLGKYKKSLKQADKAIELAKLENVDYKETTDLIENIKESQEK